MIRMDWPMYVWAAAVALVSIGAALTALRRRHLSELPLLHVAAAAIVGMFGWEMLIQASRGVEAHPPPLSVSGSSERHF